MFVGMISLNRLGVDLFPEVNFPIISITTIYSGSAPEEIENLISKPVEDEMVSLSGLKRISSRNMDGMSIVTVEFTLETDIKYAEQQVRDRMALVRPKLPDGIEEPLIKRFDPIDIPVIRLAVSANLPPTKLYDLAKETIKSEIEQVKDVGSVLIIGGTRREIQVELDRNKLNTYEISANSIANKIKSSGVNVPVGKFEKDRSEVVYRTIGQFTELGQIENIPASFAGDIGSVTLKSLASVKDGSEDETSRGFLYAPLEDPSGNSGKVKKVTKPALLLDVYKQSGSNTVAVADGIMKKIEKINERMKDSDAKIKVMTVYDGAKWIRINIKDVFETMLIGILLAVIVVYLFLGNVRSTIITGIALPNSLLGAFILMYIMGFTINVMTLLALSLTVGLLIDDAIVVRENIFRKMEEGMHPVDAAEIGTMQVALAVIATTMTVISVFFPIGFLKGIVGQFFKQFGLTVVFAMIISLFDAMTVAPLLSAYFAGKMHAHQNRLVKGFEKFQEWLEETYGKMIGFTLKKPMIVIIITSAVFILSLLTFPFIKKTFMNESDQGEFMVNIEMPPGTSLDGTQVVALKIHDRLKSVPELDTMSVVIGGNQGEANIGVIGVNLVTAKNRKRTSIEIKEAVRKMMKDFEFAKPTVSNYTMSGGQKYPFMMNLQGNDLEVLENYSRELMKRMGKISDLMEITTSLQSGKPEFQIKLDPKKMEKVGCDSGLVGMELRNHIAGSVVGKFHESGLEYDVRLRLRPEQREIKSSYYQIKVPNTNSKLIPLSYISTPVEKLGPSYILRQDRIRAIQISANISPSGGVGDAIDKVVNIMKKDYPLPKGVTYSFIGQTESFGELIDNMILAFTLSFIFIYLVLSSLYESFITPITILAAIPPALSGALYALFVTGEMFNMLSMIGIIMLMGLVTKNSILLVDFALENVRSGKTREKAILEAGVVRLRPILMTTFAMIAGTIPVALGWGEAASFRKAMGIAIVGGLVVSTMITLFVVPAIFGYIDRFREFIESKFRPKYDIDLEEKPEEEEIIETIEEEETTVIEFIPNESGFNKKKKNDSPGSSKSKNKRGK
ncbi:MAG: efflux RND transporter permease subunit [Spirochaetes bacterium]|nr:efflux RND transporter permease subunit [Spirochaetota bacterium]